MAHKHTIVECDIRRALLEVDALMARAFTAAGQVPEPGSALDQEGLRDGINIVEEFLRNGEAGLALEHLVYMVREPVLPISPETYSLIDRVGRALGMAPESWQDIRPGSGA